MRVYNKMLENDIIFEFLLGLNKELDEVRGQVHGLEPLPFIHTAFSMVIREKSRRSIMMGSVQNSSSFLDNGLALLINGTTLASNQRT